MVFSWVEVFCCPFNLLPSHLTPHILDCSLLLLSNFAQFSPVAFFSPATVNQNSHFWLQYKLLTCRNKAKVVAPAVKLWDALPQPSRPWLDSAHPPPSAWWPSPLLWLQQQVSYSSPLHFNVILQYILLLTTHFAAYCFHMRLWDTHHYCCGWMYFLWLTVQNKKSKSMACWENRMWNTAGHF